MKAKPSSVDGARLFCRVAQYEGKVLPRLKRLFTHTRRLATSRNIEKTLPRTRKSQIKKMGHHDETTSAGGRYGSADPN